MTTRALAVVRLSVLSDSSTSPERQVEHCTNLIRSRGWEHVGTAEDLDVSATKYSPFNRPELGQWLTDDPPEPWDVLVVWRLDRLIRSSRDLAELLAWCEDRGKGFVSATEGFDLRTPFGKAMAAIIAALGELEAGTVQARVTDAHRALKATDRLASGIPPFGFVPVPHPSGNGVTYEKDPDMQAVLHDMASKLLEGWSLTKITRYLSENGVLNARDRGRIRKGEKPKGAPWQTWLVRACLQSPATQGYKVIGGVQRGKPALDSEGNQIRVSPPTFDDDTWEQIQEKLKERSTSGKKRVNSVNPLLGVGVCGECGRGLHKTWSGPAHRKTFYYRCNRSTSDKGLCKGVRFNAKKLENLLEAAFLTAEGPNRVREQVFVPGSDNRAEIETLRSTLKRLKMESDAGLITDDDEYIARLKSVTTRLKELEEEPYRRSEWRTTQLDETYAERWAKEGVEGRRKLLQDANAKLYLYRDGRVHLDIESQ